MRTEETNHSPLVLNTQIIMARLTKFATASSIVGDALDILNTRHASRTTSASSQEVRGNGGPIWGYRDTGYLRKNYRHTGYCKKRY